jgi:hypothetical protein
MHQKNFSLLSALDSLLTACASVLNYHEKRMSSAGLAASLCPEHTHARLVMANAAAVISSFADECKEGLQEADFPRFVFELVDATDNELFYSLGIYHHFEEALKDASSGDSPCTDCEDYAVLEIRKRPIGFSGFGKEGEAVTFVVWQHKFSDDKEDDDGKWTCRIQDERPS